MALEPIPFDKTGVLGKLTFDTFGCNVFAQKNIRTPDILTPDITFARGVRFGLMLPTPDGKSIEVWRFEDDRNRQEVWPSPTIRVRQGQIVHSKLIARNNTHTIHHHGIEPTTFNDGVGHVSFEVEDTYTYQFQPDSPGTFFYHCHKNTVLHFEMGMYGMLIVDPPSGPGRIYEGGPRYAVEKIWVADDLDPRFRQLDHSAGLCGDDAGLNRFEPKYFCVSGVFAPNTMTHPDVVVRARVGEPILIRLLNASYSILRTTIGLPARVVGCDGHVLGGAGKPWCRPTNLAANTPFELTTAGRYDLLITPTTPGIFNARMEFLDWSRREIQNNGAGVAETRIIVT